MGVISATEEFVTKVLDSTFMGGARMSNTIEEYGYVFPYEKIKIPFRQRRDKVRWPEKNKVLAVVTYVAVEWWGREFVPGEKKALDIGLLSQEEGYNFDVGVWRALDLLD